MIPHEEPPGIAGLAQRCGRYGEREVLQGMAERVRYDLKYLRHWSPLLDLKKMTSTVTLVVRQRIVFAEY
jgi:putative colanic acid biosynthesis UDP-glucose lipid carrier transferase